VQPVPLPAAGGSSARPPQPAGGGAVPRPIPISPEKALAAAAQGVAGNSAIPDEEEISPGEMLRQNAIPLGVSFVFHLALMILLGFLTVERYKPRPVMLEATVHRQVGEQLDKVNAVASLDNVKISDYRPLASTPLVVKPVVVPISPLGIGKIDPVANMSVDSALPAHLAGRGMQGELSDKYGGTKQTTEAVEQALAWLARHQLESGMWSLTGEDPGGKGRYSRGALNENKEAATAMALLAFLGAGNTNRPDTKYGPVVDKAVTALLRQQDSAGSFYKAAGSDEWMYTQAQCTMALCELYAMTNDSKLREPCKKAVEFCLYAQGIQGGWRYRPQSDSDTSVTGWMVLALQSARNAKFDVPQENLDKVGKYLDLAAAGPAGLQTRQTTVTVEMQKMEQEKLMSGTVLGSRYGYMEGEDVNNPVMTAEGLLCRMYLGWAQNDPRLVAGVEYLLKEYPPEWRIRDVYYWYYGTQAMFHIGGEYWERWNALLRDQLVAHQEPSGPERGSWDPLTKGWPKETEGADTWAMNKAGGRLYVTCFSTYVLEVYYRHLPLYSELKKEIEKKQLKQQQVQALQPQATPEPPKQ
jgi:hypothetical protein